MGGKETKPNPAKLPLETVAVPSLFWIAVTLGRAGEVLLRAPYQRSGRRTQNSCGAAHGMPQEQTQGKQSQKNLWAR